MPFKKGEIANPNGSGTARSLLNLKWEIIDNYIAESVKKAFDIVDGLNVDIQKVDNPEKKLALQINAMRLIVSLAPQRMTDKDGNNLASPIIGFAYIKPNDNTDSSSSST